jgi:hypothetical protein
LQPLQKQAALCQFDCYQGVSQQEASMPKKKKKQTIRAGKPPTELTKRIEQWSEANGNDAHAETMLHLLGRSLLYAEVVGEGVPARFVEVLRDLDVRKPEEEGSKE